MNRAPLPAVLALLTVAFFALPVRSQVSFSQPNNADAATGPNIYSADFNNDGKLDLLNSYGVLDLGNGDGTFSAGTNALGTNGFPVLGVADFNGDLKPDILEQDIPKGALVVQLGNGDGTFQAPISTAIGAILSPSVTVDLNGDGRADVIGVSGSSLLVYIGNGDGTFKSAVSYNLGAISGAPVLSLGDFNGDQNTDVAVSVVGEEIVFLGHGDGTFQNSPIVSSGVSAPTFVAAGDFNGDGKLDLAIMCDGNPQAGVFLVLGNGNGTFQAPTALFSLYGSSVLAAADFNGDGRLDLVVEQDTTVVQIYLQNTDGTFSNGNSYVMAMPSGNLAFAQYTGIAIADFNHDGKPDIAAEDGVLLGNGDGTFQGILFSSIPANAPAATVVGDFEKNGRTDAAAVSGTTLYILQNNSQGNLSVLHSYTLQQAGQAMVTADLNGDGKLDLVVFAADQTTGDWNYSVLLGNGDGSFQAPAYYPQSVPAANCCDVVVADFNKDNKADIALITGNQNHPLAILLGNGDGTLAAATYYFDGNASQFVVADFNNDGNLDIAAGTPANGTGILYGNGDGTFQPIVFPSTLAGISASFTADINNDGKADLLGNQQVALGNGDGTFKILPALQNYVSGIADFNGDGKLDLVVTAIYLDNTQATGIQLGNGDGTFGTFTQVPRNGQLPFPALYADMNGDGHTDIVFPWDSAYVLSFKVGGLGVLLNTTPPGFELSASAPTPSPVFAGNSATSTVSAVANFGFNSTSTLSCSGLPTGAVCAFNPSSISGSSGSSTLTITTSTSMATATYPVQVKGTAGAATSTATLSLVVFQAAPPPPDFSLTPSSGSPTSQTITAGQTANFSLAITPSGGFSGTVNFSCAIKPSVTKAPTCNLPSSLQISGSGSKSVSVSVGSTANVMANALPDFHFPAARSRLLWIFGLLCTVMLLSHVRKRILAFSSSVVIMATIFLLACGGGSSSHTVQGTPAGTYTVTVTATSGSLNHNTVLQVVVH